MSTSPDWCNSPHPDLPLTCKASDPHGTAHDLHFSMIEETGDPVHWENPSYVPPPPAPSRQRTSQVRQDMLERARMVDEASREQLEEPHAYLRHDPYETEIAAADLSAVKNSRRRKQVLYPIWQSGEAGMTDDEVAASLHDSVAMHSSRTASRRKELEESGWITQKIEDGRPVTRTTRSGLQAMVWVLTPSALLQIGDVDFTSITSDGGDDGGDG